MDLDVGQTLEHPIHATEFDNCQAADRDAMALSPDGTRLAYAILEGRELNISSIVVLDVSSGQITRLESTRTENRGSRPTACTTAHGGYNGAVQWSPDGTRLVFTRSDCHNAIFAVNADGSDLRELVQMTDGPTVFPKWSLDGSSILFHSPTHPQVPDDPDALTVDVRTVRPDGTGLQALTSDGVSVWPNWTRDGRIVFLRRNVPTDGGGDLWVMDGNGGNATPLDATIPALTAAGCTVCPRPFDGNRWYSTQLNGLNEWLWQPMPASQP